MRNAVGLVLAVCVLANSAHVFAQFRGPGRGRTGGGDATEGGRSGGPRGGGQPGRDRPEEGGQPSGPPGGYDRTARLEGFLRSMDTDGDGIIHESEVPPERLRMFRFMAERAGLDPSQGVPIERIVEAMGARRGETPGSDGGRGQPPGQTATDAPAASRPEAAEQPSAPAGPPLVPGFGSDRKPSPVPGFGTRVDPPPRVVLGGTTPATAQQRQTDTNQRSGTTATGRRVSPGAERSEPAVREEDRESSQERSRENTTTQQPASYRFRAPHERLPEGLPDWFIERDLNMDGQVTMAEFAREWTDAKVEKFLRYDRNNDGIITVEEALNPLDGPVGTAADDPRTATEQRAVGEADPPERKPAESDAPTPWWLQ